MTVLLLFAVIPPLKVPGSLMQSVQCLGHHPATRCNFGKLTFKGLIRIEFGHILEVIDTLTFRRNLFEKLVIQRLFGGDPSLRIQNEHFGDQIHFVAADIFAFTPRLKNGRNALSRFGGQRQDPSQGVIRFDPLTALCFVGSSYGIKDEV